MNAPPTSPSPLTRMLALVARMRAAFPECGLSLSLLWQWGHEQRTQHHEWAQRVAAIDDEMEHAAPDLWECLKNDPPAKRQRIWTAWQKCQANTQQCHAAISPQSPSPQQL